MSYEQITLVIDKGVAIITLNRPEALNAFTGLMGEEWSDAYRRCDQNDEVKVVIVTGAGNAFCAGADMSGGGGTFDKQEDMSFTSSPIHPAWKVRKPVIGALNGHAVGVGFGLAIQCDLRVIAKEGKYGLLQVRRGVLADASSHWLLPRMIGQEKALMLHLTGRKMTGDEMFQMGLGSACVPAEEVLDTALKLAREMAVNCSPLIMGLAKKLVWDSADLSLDEMEKEETRLLHYTMGRPDSIEGGLAYMERRAPNWQSSVQNDWPDEE